MGCNSCKYLDSNNKKEGVNGAYYYCSKQKKYISGSNSECNEYGYDYGRNIMTIDQIYRDGISYSTDKTPIGTYIFFLVVLIVSGLIMGVFQI